MRKSPVILIISLLLLNVITQVGYADDSNVLSIQNVPPEISSFVFSTSNEYHNIDLTITDYNSWQDVANVTVRISDRHNETISILTFEQYENLSIKNRINRFDEFVGSENLVHDLCNISRPDSSEDYITRTVINISFVFKPFKTAETIEISIRDLGGMMASIQTPYKIYKEPSPPPMWVLFISIIIAIVLAVLEGKRRSHRNKLLIMLEQGYSREE